MCVYVCTSPAQMLMFAHVLADICDRCVCVCVRVGVCVRDCLLCFMQDAILDSIVRSKSKNPHTSTYACCPGERVQSYCRRCRGCSRGKQCRTRRSAQGEQAL